MDEAKAKLDNVHKLLRKQVCLVEDAEAVDTEGRAEEEDVNFFSGSGFQGSGNHGGFWKPWWKYGGEGREAARRRFRSRESDELQRIALVSINPSNKHRSLEKTHQTPSGYIQMMEKKGKSGETSEERGGGANEKENESFRKRVFRIPLDRPFDEPYFTHRLWMFFRETRETEEDIRRILCEARQKMRMRIILKKKSDPGQFAIPGLQTKQLCVTLIDPHVHYNPIPVKKPHTSSRRINDPGIIATCHCRDEYETEYSASIEAHTATSIDSAQQKLTDAAGEESVDSSQGEWGNDY
ncbi:hypothetical protein DY000_02022232 [Brassica cretica]|uniref:Uncharacterized protein n=1 Tax=Brassica cretica TaxID=69181 RepID=A0ABQ7EG80_BRACR|nr:hypothetical protein DY000_02022232 [Brassica cretica]